MQLIDKWIKKKTWSIQQANLQFRSAYFFCTGQHTTLERTDDQSLTAFIESLHPIKDESWTLKRLGSAEDGGYLIPDCLKGISACFSPGVSSVSSFEKECANLGMDVFLADHSVDGPAEADVHFSFLKKYLAASSDGTNITLDEWVNKSCPHSKSDLLLQMDIEGSEYETILSASEELISRFRIMVIEFHNLADLWAKPFFPLASATVKKILKTHSCVHIHPNNTGITYTRKKIKIPNTMEITFLRKDYIKSPSPHTAFPHPLDTDNRANIPSAELPECWYRKPDSPRKTT